MRHDIAFAEWGPPGCGKVRSNNICACVCVCVCFKYVLQMKQCRIIHCVCVCALSMCVCVCFKYVLQMKQCRIIHCEGSQADLI